ncbi:hypothetical protein LG198_11370 [Methylobacillus arboreus]|uniref:hypothetical protein n=1 Tax=Methylobacillus arboreus TaxID=755170 RepID=UPI001E49F5C5|nr:hypothetical protein [Methylobacillus arboreus]MCB5191327.1 hypothetical protein [Methylobacillus arboreus]
MKKAVFVMAVALASGWVSFAQAEDNHPHFSRHFNFSHVDAAALDTQHPDGKKLVYVALPKNLKVKHFIG